MRLCTFILVGEHADRQRAGLVEGSRVHEFSKPTTIMSLLDSEEGEEVPETKGNGYELANVVMLAPVPRPGKIVATIVNTQGMLGGSDVKLERPRLDMKAPSTVIGPGAEIIAPTSGIRPEVELAAVVGRRITGGTEEEADGAIFGFTVLNDVTAPSDSRDDAYEAYRRDKSSGQIKRATLRGPLFRSKNHDTFCPMGPWIVTTEELKDWSSLRMTTKFDGLLVQDGSTSEYIFNPSRIIAYVSRFLTLEPGDIVSCGSVGWTPAALGSLDPTEFVLPLRRGLLELEIEGIGPLGNQVTLEPDQ